MTDDLLPRLNTVSTTWSPHQRLHPGNVAWAHCRGDGRSAPDATFAWDGAIVGFADVWHAAAEGDPAEVSLHVSPRAAAEQRLAVVHELLDAYPVVTLEVSRQDVALVDVLEATGLREAEGPWYAQLWRDLHDLSDVEHRRPPPGYHIRPVVSGDAEDVSARVEVHRRAWAPTRVKGLLGEALRGDEQGSSYSMEKHRAVTETVGYHPELDLVAVGPDGDVAAYALGWLDERSHSLLFEPVGTDPAHSERGLARALCVEMMRTARRLGAMEAVVGPRGDNGYPIPRRVYEGLGMREVAQFVPMTNVPPVRPGPSAGSRPGG